MVSYLMKRTFQVVWSVLIAISATFAMARWMPGDAMDYIISRLYTTQGPEAVSEQRLDTLLRVANLAVDRPLHEQYIIYMQRVLGGDLGVSVIFGVPVEQLLFDAMPWTILIAVLALLFETVIGLVLGAVMAYTEGSRFDKGASVYSILTTSTPYYVIAIILLAVLAFQVELFPSGGRVDPDLSTAQPIAFAISALRHAALPVLSLVITGIGGWALGMRANSISVMGEDYIRVAKLRGLTDRRIATRYVGRNALLPMYTRLMIGLGTIFGGAVVLESIFRYRGVGLLLFKSISARDIPLMMGTFLFITIGMMVGVYIADLTYGWIDPRATVGDQYE